MSAFSLSKSKIPPKLTNERFQRIGIESLEVIGNCIHEIVIVVNKTNSRNPQAKWKNAGEQLSGEHHSLSQA